MASGAWLLYGANGSTGRLIAEEAVQRGEEPVLAGRREEAVRPVAESLGLDYRVFPVTGVPTEWLARELESYAAVLLAAGPFSATSGPVADACIDAGSHYLDITGEIAVFEALHRRGTRAGERGCVLLPGVGFDVVPSDCLAATLGEWLPEADSLELALAPAITPTPGTALTMVEGLPQGGAVRQDGRIRKAPVGAHSRTVPFRDRERTVVSIPWGDVSTAYHSTGIPNIVVSMAVPAPAVPVMRLSRPLLPLLGFGPVQRALAAAARRAPGPGAARKSGRSHLWGRVSSARGEERTATLETPEAYRLTVLAALESVRRVAGGQVQPGFHTPSTAFGAGYITEFPDCDLAEGDGSRANR